MREEHTNRCLDLPFDGTRSLQADEVDAIKLRCTSKLRNRRLLWIAILLLGLIIAYVAIQGYAELAILLSAVLLLFAWVSFRFGQVNRSKRVLAELQNSTVLRFKGTLPGYLVEHDATPPQNYANGRVFEANMEAYWLLLTHLHPQPDIEQEIEVFPSSRILYSINGTFPKAWYATAPTVGDELLGNDRLWEPGGD